ncbi:tRNA preQ1(34) S-adenosylmethionine ribosyltransferase-isomerase QueA [Fluoribacter dumoffii]|uniref:S-adenosylmethionine:tRNA ribosyltransferase-isomerase n=1 Tax=Fluoribacter dumoffii TaxID=463 RepID=A0A377G8P8_9GAMM|nr:tRNA preQ1(34) S-adenosylmethionine ribosyltransferase-isomerase QueA [Fluoribacter dumoffii]KTC89768.1 S-adenosylmethionine:tRNA ribosyltransferase-isomerase [Fluoribacter dumoffii NY 23]MCW8384963.1 tRNA preQ1(34) S-adenosylmethionine ribosyltransferase-isomerase QueA [Fluoribacter dumoffii]MCW8418024.1 tRNA preQ1(34) S-adenosylmethionine ribosyltransferase-isomerase QueA [Fluoribacter dumoffii]MCW8454134.1 tRNA preQ1(34) S-adenosylmethionine ribosyltransferase-isomerase QueA [Fluoribacter
MNKQDFYFDLPPELIAQYPLANRSDSRLLIYNRQKEEYGHYQFREIADFLNPGDLLVMNDSKVIPARLYGHKTTGGKVELLVERITGEFTFLAHIKASKALKAGSIIQLEQNKELEILDRQDDLFVCKADMDVLTLLNGIGHIPLPPYITRNDENLDQDRYQTVYAKYEGSVAAPTAGLHFDEAVLSSVRSRGVSVAYLTLHVGAGTFRPVRCEDIKDHKMHSERFTIGAELCEAVHSTKAAGNRVIAVGTTAMRSLESAAQNGTLTPCSRDTDIFIYPGYEFKICDGLMTNFHLPESTLLMLVSAFIGHKQAMKLYQEAIEKKYRFFSYGDTSLLL